MKTIHENIISEENLEPKPNTEYIYNLDMIWIKGKFESIPIKQGTIVYNVEQMEAGDYSFNIKGKTETYCCTYGWAFIENTERNIELLKQIEAENILLKQQELKIPRFHLFPSQILWALEFRVFHMVLWLNSPSYRGSKIQSFETQESQKQKSRP